MEKKKGSVMPSTKNSLPSRPARLLKNWLPTAFFFLVASVGLLFGFFVAVHTKSDGAEEVEEDVHTAGHRAGVIQAVQIPGELLRQGNAFF